MFRPARSSLLVLTRLAPHRRRGWQALGLRGLAVVAALWWTPQLPASDRADAQAFTRAAADALPALPERLSETGLYLAGSTGDTAPGVLTFTPQYPLWSDGSTKRRWVWLAPGSFIDAAEPDAWVFPPGTRLWKEFAHAGRAVETRLIERLPDGSWRFAAYVWDADGRDAVLAPPRGARLPVAAAPGGRYVVPSRRDCLACHGGTAVPVLGLGALQLSPDRDPLAPNRQPAGSGDVDLRELVARGWLRNLPPALLDRPPRIAADTPVERAALGYLHGNCAHCHNTTGSQVPVSLTLAQSVSDPEASLREVLRSAMYAPTEYRPPGTADDRPAIVPGRLDDSVLAVRMQSRHPHVQMPPLGTQAPDPEGLALVHRWITQDLPHRKDRRP